VCKPCHYASVPCAQSKRPRRKVVMTSGQEMHDCAAGIRRVELDAALDHSGRTRRGSTCRLHSELGGARRVMGNLNTAPRLGKKEANLSEIRCSKSAPGSRSSRRNNINLGAEEEVSLKAGHPVRREGGQ